MLYITGPVAHHKKVRSLNHSTTALLYLLLDSYMLQRLEPCAINSDSRTATQVLGDISETTDSLSKRKKMVIPHQKLKKKPKTEMGLGFSVTAGTPLSIN